MGPTSTIRQDPASGTNEDVILVVGRSLRVSLLLRVRSSARLVIFRELLQALDYLRHNRVAQIFIEPSAFGAASRSTAS